MLLGQGSILHVKTIIAVSSHESTLQEPGEIVSKPWKEIGVAPHRDLGHLVLDTYCPQIEHKHPEGRECL